MADASARGLFATGPRRGRRLIRVRGPTATMDALVLGRLCAQVEGYNLQAATRIGASDRQGLERMARYLARALRSRLIAECCAWRIPVEQLTRRRRVSDVGLPRSA